jgi:predicted amidohydrolase YtcJ
MTMRHALAAALAGLVLAACDGAEDADTRPAAQTVFTGATIYTGLSADDTASALAVGEDGRIVWVGEAEALDGELSGEPEIVDLGGAYMYPGFTDAHAHLLGIGQREMMLDLTGTTSLDELVTRIDVEAFDLPEGAVLFGRGWIETGWPEGRMPTAADLDAVAPGKIVILVRADGHALVASTAALQAAGIGPDTPDPEGGRIERGADGKATGLLIDTAMSPVMQLVSEPSETDLIEAYETGARLYASRGWTGMHNMSVDPAHAAMIQRLAAGGRLPVRLYNAFDPDGFEIAAGREFETATLTNRAVKVYMDGALGSRGALLSKPYADRPGETGLALLSRTELEDLLVRADREGVALAIHAIGDLANTRVLDAVETVFGGDVAPLPDGRWRIEHAQILRPEDISRFAELGVIASMQPSHAIGDLFFAPDRLGLARLEGAYAWQSLLDAGVVIAGGSDAPVEVGSPNIEFYAATVRKSLDGFQGEGWAPEEAVSRFDALRMLTAGPAYAAFMEDDLGTIEVGKLADFSVFDGDFMTAGEQDMLAIEPVMTIVGGEIVWQRDDSPETGE